MAIIEHYFSKFPTGDDGVDRELAAILVHLKAPGIVTTLCGMLSASVKGVASTNLGDDEALMTAYAAQQQFCGRDQGVSLTSRRFTANPLRLCFMQCKRRLDFSRS